MIYIWVRATVPWGEPEAARSQVRPELRRRLDLWNETFNLPYQRFRERVAQIAGANHSRVEGARLASWDEIPDGALVLPVDDDDWFAPDAARVLAAASAAAPRARGYLWDSRWIEVPISAGHRLYLARRRLFPWTAPKWICTTNNYAMPKDAAAQPILGNHITASHWFAPRLGDRAGTIKRVEQNIGIANRTLASLTSLRVHQPRHRFRRAELLRKFHRYRSLYERPPPDELAWASPYVEMMAGLMGELEPAPQ